eukprot:Phypoly_transcript_19121.p1 GENE.Phypoly_transcript_19121~~Phypoly_transcript_19121.p1  ORF type:complete len:186 (+),score=20.97 Phypoly_transcript_19121:75-560(+)
MADSGYRFATQDKKVTITVNYATVMGLFGPGDREKTNLYCYIGTLKDPKEKHFKKLDVIKHNCAPTWDNQFKFVIPLYERVFFQFWHHNVLTKDEYLGTAEVDFLPFYQIMAKTGKTQLTFYHPIIEEDPSNVHGKGNGNINDARLICNFNISLNDCQNCW